EEFVFGHDENAFHAPRLAHVDLIRPIAVVGELIFGQAPLSEGGLNVLWHARIVGDEIETALLIGSVFAKNFPASFVTGFGVIVAITDIVSAHRAMIVDVGFV